MKPDLTENILSDILRFFSVREEKKQDGKFYISNKKRIFATRNVDHYTFLQCYHI